MNLSHLDLFSGIGGFALAASRVWPAHKVAAFCEIDPFCQRVLAKHWPDAIIHDDIRTLDGNAYANVDLLTRGFPCQPFSVAGKRKGAKDDRALWPEMLRVIRESRPRWIVGENVSGIVAMELDRVLSDLEVEGYATRTFAIPACAVDAPHKRERIWIVANANGEWRSQQEGSIGNECGWTQHGSKAGTLEHTRSQRRQQVARCAHGDEVPNEGRAAQYDHIPASTSQSHWATTRTIEGRRLPESGIHALAHGIPERLARLRAVGNAIVPQVAEVIFRQIAYIKSLTTETQ